MAIILSLGPNPAMPSGVGDKFVHYCGYMLMSAGALAFAWRYRSLAAAALATVLGGILIEFAQGFVPGRHPEFADALANLAGAATGLLLASALLALVRLSLSRRA